MTDSDAFYQRCVEIGAPRCQECGQHHFPDAPHLSPGLAALPAPSPDETVAA